MDNANPLIYEKTQNRVFTALEMNEDYCDKFDNREVYDMIRNIKDPEHPLTLEQLNVVDEDNVFVDDENNIVEVNFTPTINHCSAATLIGLSIMVKLMRCLPERFKTTVKVAKGSHDTEEAINKQLNDKERVSAAIENTNLLQAINRCLVDDF